MKPYYEDDFATIYHGDCREVLDGGLPTRAAIISDPPYGMGWDPDSTRFTGGASGLRSRGIDTWAAVAGDDKPFDPTAWLGFDEVILWGANHYAARLPVGTTLVWIKRFDAAFGSFLSDAEVAWSKGGHGVYCFRDTSENGHNGIPRYHPTQKPLALMRWCVRRTKAPLVIDPYMGSGTTLRAAKDLGRRAIGIEIDERYCEIAAKRLAQEVLDFGGVA